MSARRSSRESNDDDDEDDEESPRSGAGQGTVGAGKRRSGQMEGARDRKGGPVFWRRMRKRTGSGRRAAAAGGTEQPRPGSVFTSEPADTANRG